MNIAGFVVASSCISPFRFLCYRASYRDFRCSAGVVGRCMDFVNCTVCARFCRFCFGCNCRSHDFPFLILLDGKIISRRLQWENHIRLHIALQFCSPLPVENLLYSFPEEGTLIATLFEELESTL
jgi:hypothetical protein